MSSNPDFPVEPRSDDPQDSVAPPIPDALDLVVEVADVMAVLAAQRFVRIDGMRREALADAARYGSGMAEVTEHSIRLELAAALRVTEYAAGMLIGQAEALVRRYPRVLESLRRARITEQHATALVDAVDQLESDLRETVASQALAMAESLALGSFRRGLRTLIDVVRSATLAERHEDALRSRRVVRELAAEGMAWTHIYWPAVEALAADNRVTAIAKVLAAQDGETRTLDQLRADVLGDLLIDGDTTVHPDQARGIRATVAVTVPALALLSDDADSSEPAVVEGLGPIPIERARALCGGAKGWMRILTHPETGMVLSVGRDQYRPPPGLRRLVRWRADRCLAPGCGVPASRCQIDHNVAWEHGGVTALNNLAPLCVRHHTVKHHGGWRVRQLADSGGAMEWTSPAGRVYTVEPQRSVPVFRPAEDDSTPPF